MRREAARGRKDFFKTVGRVGKIDIDLRLDARVLDKLKPTPARTQQRNRALYGIVWNAGDKGERCGERNV